MAKKNTHKMDILSAVLLLIVSALLDPGSCCPTQCACNSTTKHVFCSDTTMAGIPSSIPSDTLALGIAGTFGSRFVHVTHLLQSDLARMKDLEELYISHSDLATVEENALQGLVKLRRVTLSYNKLSRIPKGLFENLPNLANIDLTGNANCIVEPGSFAGIPSLRFLYAGNMNIGTLPTDAFQGLSSLKGLYIQGNNLKYLDEAVLSSLTSLEVLDIEDNDLKTLPQGLEPQLSKLKSFYVSDNPWHCNCDIEWMKNLPTVATASMGSNSLVLCLGPDRFKYQNLNKIPSSEVKCIPPKIISCGEPYNVNLGASLTISCLVEGDPDPVISFTNPDQVTADDTNVVTGYHLKQNYTFVIDKVTKSEEGKWNVAASNREGTDGTTFNIHVLNIPTTTTSTSTTSITATTTTIPSTSLGYSTAVAEHSLVMTMSAVPAELATSAQRHLSGIKDPVIKAVTEDHTGVIIAGVFGGLTFIAVSSILGYMLYKKLNKNSVKPFKEEPNDYFDVNVHRVEGYVPPVSTAWK